ncbi:FAD-binding oxidoreductase [Candidatus Solincola tengchongensis]|uniref:FAD-binding oxidoreductase n=1 Tax=Candidatus Solincola tengchongensis TaxID=2900693 RepID=UPI00258005A0|nr:FAD-binding oxidoreductase [Candidatus Solincola tengchongensis]
MIPDDAFRELQVAVGEENASREPAVLDTYAWQPFLNEDPALWTPRPEAVVLPGSTDEVRAVVRVCNRHGLRFKALCTGWGVHAGPTAVGVVQVDLRRMDRILDIDEKNMIAVVEPCVSGAQLQAEAMKRGLNTHLIGAGPVCSPLASATSMHGVGHDGIYMSYSPRNLLGVEWVLPDGELLRLGSPGSGLGWFTGDGPGPSLRGIMRGASGAFGGLGIFTKCALKLFNWPGPPSLRAEGTVFDSVVEQPPNLRFYGCVFHRTHDFAEAMYALGEAEIGYLCLRVSLASFPMAMTPKLYRKIMRTKNLRAIAYEALRYPFTVLLAGDSMPELEYQEAVLREIVHGHEGIILDMQHPPLGPLLPLNLIRASLIPAAFRLGGTFCTNLDGNDALDSQMPWSEAIAEVKRPWIERGAILDDGAENPYFVPYENNTWAHCEVVHMYSVHEEKSLQALKPIAFASTLEAIERCMTPLSVLSPEVRKALSPLAGNFNRWQKGISAALDPCGAADTGLYTAERDFDTTGVDPEKVKRFERLSELLRWTDEGPPP